MPGMGPSSKVRYTVFESDCRSHTNVGNSSFIKRFVFTQKLITQYKKCSAKLHSYLLFLFGFSLKSSKNLVLTIERCAMCVVIFDIASIFHNVKQSSIAFNIGHDIHRNVVLLRRLVRLIVVEVLAVLSD